MPSRYRDELVSRCGGQLIVTIDLKDPCLNIYPLAEWERIEESLSALASLNEKNRALQRLLVGNAVDLEMDGNARILIPSRLRDHAKLDKHVMLVGHLRKFQLWDEQAWNDQAASDLAALREPDALSEELQKLVL